MSIIRLFALRNLLIVACAIAAGLAIYKGIQISQKIHAVQEADEHLHLFFLQCRQQQFLSLERRDQHLVMQFLPRCGQRDGVSTRILCIDLC